MSTTVSNASDSPLRESVKYGDEPRFSSMSLHKVYATSVALEGLKLRYLIPKIPNYLYPSKTSNVLQCFETP